jgi:glycerophosphoryl diester phosphodiesterase
LTDALREKPLLLGHRGARRYAPENTIAAFELALAHGCDGFEFDVRLTADLRGVICHDAKLAGLTVARERYDKLEDACRVLLPETLTIDRGRFSPEMVVAPCLEAVLDGFVSRAFLDIELKVLGLEGLVTRALSDHPPRRGYYVSSFLPEVLERMHACDSGVPLGLICDSQRQLAAWTRLPIQAVFLERRLATAAIVETLHAANKKVFVWTVNRERDMRRFAQLAVEGIISDDTRLLMQTLGEDNKTKTLSS